MIEFSENGKLCTDSKLKRDLDLMANRSVTLDIWKFKVFVFLTKIQSYAPLPFDAFIPKLMHVYLKTTSQNPIRAKNQFCMFIKVRNSLLSRMSVSKVCIVSSLSQYIHVVCVIFTYDRII